MKEKLYELLNHILEGQFVVEYVSWPHCHITSNKFENTIGTLKMERKHSCNHRITHTNVQLYCFFFQ